MKNLINNEWLAQNLENPKLILLEAHIRPIGVEDKSSPDKKIGNAQIFDIEAVFSDHNSPLPHTLPTAENFEKEARKLGIDADSLIVVYDRFGVYASPRVWWLFKTMGHQNIAVLDGGMPAWEKSDLPLSEKNTDFLPKKGNFEAHFQEKYVSSQLEVFENIDKNQKLLIDARSSERFFGKVAEPRQGLRRGHIPKSVNIPFQNLLENGHFLPKNQLLSIFENVGAANKGLIFSCGSGVTACIVALGAVLADYSQISVYDGSWSEWGQNSDFPVV